MARTIFSVLLVIAGAARSASGEPLALHPANGRYFLWRGSPTILVTSGEHYGAVLNLDFDYSRYLDALAADGLNHTRTFSGTYREIPASFKITDNTLAPKPNRFACPWARSDRPGYFDGGNKFDLSRFEPAYFERLKAFTAAADRRGIVVEMTLFCPLYNDDLWKASPMNAANNVNGVGDCPRTEVLTLEHPRLLEIQTALVKKFVLELNAYDNFYFEVCNEPFGNHPGHASVAEIEAWQDAVRATIREEEARLGKRHMIFQVPVEEWRTDGTLDRLADAETIDGINFHDYQKLTYKGIVLPPMGRFMQRDLNLARVIYLWTVGHAIGKPLVFDEDNACTNGLDEESWTIHRKRAWGVVCSGGHYDMIDFSIQASGQETGTPASQAHIRTWMKHLSSFIHGVDFLHMTPVRDFAAQLPEHTIAATLANAGQEYVIYLADKREIEHPGHGDPCGGTMVFELPAGKYKVRRYDPASGEYVGDAQSIEGGEVSVDVPSFTHDVVVYIKAR